MILPDSPRRTAGITMLILTRGMRQSIRIGDDVVVTIAGISGQQVKLAFEAPKEIAIMREELLLRDAQKAKVSAQK